MTLYAVTRWANPAEAGLDAHGRALGMRMGKDRQSVYHQILAAQVFAGRHPREVRRSVPNSRGSGVFLLPRPFLRLT
jgi:hypothetical protein